MTHKESDKSNFKVISGGNYKSDQKENLINLVRNKREAIINGNSERANAIQKSIKGTVKKLLEAAGGRAPEDY